LGAGLGLFGLMQGDDRRDSLVSHWNRFIGLWWLGAVALQARRRAWDMSGTFTPKLIDIRISKVDTA
jgi:hypothetical protein